MSDRDEEGGQEPLGCGDSQGLFRPRDWDREIMGYQDKEQMCSRETWQDGGNYAEMRTASEDMDTGYLGGQ